MKKVGIIICDRWRRCAGGKCFRALQNREGAFGRYRGQEIEIAGYTTCDGCPGGNVEYAPAEMMRNSVEVVNLATGLLVGYPPCPYIDDFQRFITAKFGVEVVLGTHPIPQSYDETHRRLGTWDSPEWRERIRETLTDESMRKNYD